MIRQRINTPVGPHLRGAYVIAQEHLDLQLSAGVTLGEVAESVGVPSEAAKSYDATLALLARAWLRLPPDNRAAH